MKKGFFKRVVAVLITGLMVCVSVPAQYTYGPYGMRSASAPTLRNRTRVSRGLRVGVPRLSFVSRIGGVAFDGVAKPAADLSVNTLTLGYSSASSDGERLSVTINNEPVSAPIYDWQLIPIANFVNSDSFSCFTLFGELADERLQAQVIENGGSVLNYHSAFFNNLMGLRLFQLDSLIISDYSWDLIKNGPSYVLGAGEQPPNTSANKKGLAAFARFRSKLPEYDSYVISDNRRNIVFRVKDGLLTIDGEPSYYFWSLDKELLTEKKVDEAMTNIGEQLLTEATKAAGGSLTPEEWLRSLLIAEARTYDREVGNYQIVQALNFADLTKLLSTRGAAARRAIVNRQDVDALLGQLVLLRTLKQIQHAVEVRELSDQVSNETEMLRAINPTVWDAGVNLLRYGAFFRYVKENHPQQWRAFMRQVRRAPRPRPYVITPTIVDGISGRDQ